jgi:Rrf2 family transcriptional regulator, nitric oxide-sensitive transcriptional repressor
MDFQVHICFSPFFFPVTRGCPELFSQTVEYSMRAVLALAAGNGKPMTTQKIAETMKVPRSYLSKVLQSLVRGGLVYSTRGLKGGFVLVKSPEEISMLAIVNSVNPMKRIKSCPLDVDSHSSDLCPLHSRLDKAMAMVEEAFSGTTLAEILSEENPCPTLQAQLQKLEPKSKD